MYPGKCAANVTQFKNKIKHKRGQHEFSTSKIGNPTIAFESSPGLLFQMVCLLLNFININKACIVTSTKAFS